uniref:Uncharacterized protein n=1 Tax=Acrobeloides nanus TaxID=290746 RepID=A0A914D573_9BILA
MNKNQRKNESKKKNSSPAEDNDSDESNAEDKNYKHLKKVTSVCQSSQCDSSRAKDPRSYFENTKKPESKIL